MVTSVVVYFLGLVVDGRRRVASAFHHSVEEGIALIGSGVSFVVGGGLLAQLLTEHTVVLVQAVDEILVDTIANARPVSAHSIRQQGWSVGY